ncbi:MAG: class I SAM-dependent DNA methyltransferase [Deltaproteobacteria bacterium]|jgi:hypothetical protein|nr:class I SAM-dependent DNA methyltransferase [Deltaproteobacteria bacterium]
MRLSWEEIQSRAATFSKRWESAHSEESQSQMFIKDLLNVFGVENPELDGGFEYKVYTTDNSERYIDYLWKKNIAIEMKSKGKDLDQAYLQLKNHMRNLQPEDMPDIWLVCDFENMRLYRRSTNQKWKFKTKILREYIQKFSNIAGYTVEHKQDDPIELNVKAAEKMALLHDQLKSHGYEKHELEIYLVRFLYCLFAEHSGIFPEDNFKNYLEKSKSDGSDFSFRIQQLFHVLNLSEEERINHTLLTDVLKSSKYINGNLFKDALHLADFDAKTRKILIDCALFDWSGISPAIFGAMFQGVMDKHKRRMLGAHYTSEKNMLKLINTLFMNELWNEFEHVKSSKEWLPKFHDKISQLKFLDPACGCGNFLIIAYRELRRLELEVLKMKITTSHLRKFDIHMELKVGVEQFYGIELEEYPCQISQVGMWLMDHQMNMLVSQNLGQNFTRLPLTKSATIICGNALRLDWKEIIPIDELSYIMGNPPFIGSKLQNDSQRADIVLICKDKSDNTVKRAAMLDYVAGWYFKAAHYIKNTNIRAAFVSTNSITQGEQVAVLFRPLIEDFGINIDFAWRTFRWSNEARGQATVNCVIVGFSSQTSKSKRIIYEDDTKIVAKHINPYLVDAPDIFIETRLKPICDVPEISMGNQPIDNGNYLFTKDEKDQFLIKEPRAAAWFRPWIGADEFINGYTRYCLFLKNCPPTELRKMPEVMKRVEAVQIFRLASKSPITRKLAQKPLSFNQENCPASNYIIIPEVSSERRRYIPIGFLTPEALCSNLVKIIPSATLYHFGVLTSNVHMAWVRLVCGRMRTDYRYSNHIVYNNFIWPDTTEKQRIHIESSAKNILEVREQFPDHSLADLYDPLAMPDKLLKAHQNLDRDVMKAYKFDIKCFSEEKIVAELMEMYKHFVDNKDIKSKKKMWSLKNYGLKC